MTRDDIIRMAREAGLLPEKSNIAYQHPFFEQQIELFAALVASAEREEILAFAISEAFNRQYGEKSPFAYELANAIQARGQA